MLNVHYLCLILSITEMYVQMSVKPPMWNFTKIASVILQVKTER